MLLLRDQFAVGSIFRAKTGGQSIVARCLATILGLSTMLQFSLCQAMAVTEPALSVPATSASGEVPKVDFTLTPVASPEKALEGSKIVAAESLSDERLTELVSRLAPLDKQTVPEFRLPEQSLVKPKLPGTETMEPFPPKAASIERPRVSTVGSAPLRVSRVSPEGAVDEANELAVTFSQPMVPISEVKVADPSKFLTLQPQPTGQWEWAGTQTLLFHPSNAEKRLPKATNYQLVVPASTKSVLGVQMAEEQHWQITTPTLSITRSYPHENRPLPDAPIMVQLFNQDIDRKAVFAHMRLTDGQNDFPIHMVEDSEVIKLSDYKNVVEDIPNNRWIAVQSDRPLPLNTHYQLRIVAGCPSAEGPEATKSEMVSYFFVHGPFALLHSPNGGDIVDNFSAAFGFSNDIGEDVYALQSAPVTISPPIPECKVFISGSWLSIRGKYQPFHRYRVTIDAGLTDVFGQKLGKAITHSFTTGPRPTYLRSYSDFITVAPDQKPTVSMMAQATPAVNVRIFRVGPEDWGTYKNINWHEAGEHSIGSQVGAKSFKIGIDSAPVSVDLSPYLLHRHGQFVVVAKCRDEKEKKDLTAACWVQVTNIGISAFRGKKLIALATSLANGSPIADAAVKLSPNNCSATTNASGQAELDAGEDKLAYAAKHHRVRPDQWHVISIQKGDDLAILPQNTTWSLPEERPTIQWYCVSDRSLYRPGETVFIKGWARGLRYSDKGAIDLFDAKLHSISYTLKDSGGVELGHGEAKVDSVGAFSFPATLPKKTNLGNFIITVSAVTADLGEFPCNAAKRDTSGSESEVKDYSANISFSVEEFRRPEFVMKVKAPKSPTLFLGETTRLSSESSYFGGGALPHAEVTWTARAMPWSFSPPGYPQYTFGGSPSYWNNKLGSDRTHVTKTVESKSNSQGESAVELMVKSLSPAVPHLFTCEATMFDVNRQQWSDRVAFTVHPAKTCVGLKIEPTLRQGDPVEVKVMAADIDGKANPGRPIDIRLLKKSDSSGALEVFKKNFVSGLEPLDLRFQLNDLSEYEMIATVTDDGGRKSETILSFNRYHRVTSEPRGNQIKSITITSNQKQYQPGDTAEIKLESVMFPAHGIALISRHNVVSTMPLDFAGPTQVLRIPITEDDYPNLTVEALLDGDKSGFACGRVELLVPPLERTLALSVKPAVDEISPGSDTSISVDLKDNKGVPVAGGHVAIAAVDEALLALRGYKWHDPLHVFYPNYSASAIGNHSRSSILFPPAKDESEITGNTVSGRKRTHPKTSVFFRDQNLFQVEPSVLDERHYSSGRAERHQQLAQLNSVDRDTLNRVNRFGFDILYGQPVPFHMLALKGAPMPDNGVLDTNANRPMLISQRSNFSILALFAPDVVTDQNGHAQVPMHLPDNVTRYKIMAAVTSGFDKYGSAESTISTRLGLVIKPSPPRFLNYGDRFELPIVVQNQTDKAISAEVILRAQNAIIAGNADAQVRAAGKKIEIPAGDRVEVRFPLATKDAGNVDIQCAVVSNDLTDAADISIPVFMPATMESFATYGQIDKGAGAGAIIQKLSCPKDIFKQVGGLTITTSSTALQALADAYLYLRKYPYGCSEQLSSKLIAMLSLHDVLVAFETLNPESEAKFKQEVQDTVDLLASRQSDSGDFGLWAKDDPGQWPFVSLQASHALLLAERKDYKVDARVLERCRSLLKQIDNHIPSDYSNDARLAVEARALNIRFGDGDIDSNAARLVIHQALDTLKPGALHGAPYPTPSEIVDRFVSLTTEKIKAHIPLEMAAWLLPVVSKDKDSSVEADLLRRVINNSIEETASTASTNSPGYGTCDYLMFYSPRRTDAVVMEALIEDKPDNELIAKLAKGLLAHKKNGAWDGTQENYCILQALDKYFAVYEKETPNFKSQEWLGNDLIGLQKFAGRSTESKTINIPVDYLLKNLSDEVLIEKTGPGRLYYRIGLDYAPRNLNLKPAQFGFSIEREYEAIDDKSDVKKDNDGIWHIKAGATVRAKLHFRTVGARYHVALMDPLPAGTEPVNASLAGNRTLIEPAWRIGQPESFQNSLQRRTSRRMQQNGYLSDRWWRRSWFEHQNLRDHQAEAFASMLNAGEYNYTYLMRATTPGNFVVSPAKVEEMYSSETFGRTGTDHVIVE